MKPWGAQGDQKAFNASLEPIGWGIALSKKREEAARMPAASAGLLRFFEEESPGIKIRPEMVLIIAGALIALSLASIFMP
jgi:preprotein translocase subunit Sec61beta